MSDHRLPAEDEWGEAIGGLSGQLSGVPDPDPSFRDALLGMTGRRVRARHHRRVALQVIGAMLLFASGWAFGAWGEAPSNHRIHPIVDSPPQAAPTVPADPADLERALAGASPEVRREKLLEAADEYLGGGEVDPSSALYCYRQILDDEDQGKGGALEISPEDSWLLKALRVARN